MNDEIMKTYKRQCHFFYVLYIQNRIKTYNNKDHGLFHAVYIYINDYISDGFCSCHLFCECFGLNAT